MKYLTIIVVSLALAMGLQAVPQGGSVQVKGTLILASNSGQGLDSSLKPYEGQLRRLGFSSYKAIGRGGTGIRVPGTGTINFGRGMQANIKINAAPGRKIPVEVRWTEGRKTLVHTSGALPLLAGGPRNPNGTLILILDGR